MNYDSVEQIDELFRIGQFPLDRMIEVKGIEYQIIDNIMYPIPDMVEKGYKGFVVYAITPKGRQSDAWKYSQAKGSALAAEGQVDEWIVLIWTITQRLYIVPARARTTTKARGKSDLQTATGALKEAQNVIPDIVDVKFRQFNKSIKGKADTGANMSSLHVDNWQIIPNADRVKFTSKMLSNNEFTVVLHDHVHVKTGEGSEYRPVIALDVSINGVDINGALFNLNDRSHMQSPLLIGQNILEKGNFLVDPNIHKDHPMESVDWDELQERFKDVEPIEEDLEEKTRKIKELYEMMLECDVPLGDLMKHIKSIAYTTLENLEY